MTMKLYGALISAILLSACAAQPAALKEKRPPAFIPPTGVRPIPGGGTGAGLDRVLGKDARSLVGMFGPATLDVREEGSRKLQFGGAGCVLDAYLYPSAKGREPITTYVVTRLPDGRETDKAACIMQLTRGR